MPTCHLLPSASSTSAAGPGQATLPLARRGYEVTILDSSKKMLNRAQDALERQRPH